MGRREETKTNRARIRFRDPSSRLPLPRSRRKAEGRGSVSLSGSCRSPPGVPCVSKSPVGHHRGVFRGGGWAWRGAALTDSSFPLFSRGWGRGYPRSGRRASRTPYPVPPFGSDFYGHVPIPSKVSDRRRVRWAFHQERRSHPSIGGHVSQGEGGPLEPRRAWKFQNTSVAVRKAHRGHGRSRRKGTEHRDTCRESRPSLRKPSAR